MTRNLKILGLALVAVFAINAVVASSAFAVEKKGFLTADGPFWLTGTDEPTGNALTYPGLPAVTCPESHYKGEAVGSANLITSTSTAFTVTPTYTNCFAGGTPPGTAVTVNMNGCDYVFTITTTTETADEYELDADLICPAGKEVDVESFLSKDPGTVICTLKFGEQKGLKGLDIKDLTNGELTITGTAKGIKASRSGLCGAASTEAAEYDVKIILTGENEKSEATKVNISEIGE